MSHKFWLNEIFFSPKFLNQNYPRIQLKCSFFNSNTIHQKSRSVLLWSMYLHGSNTFVQFLRICPITTVRFFVLQLLIIQSIHIVIVSRPCLNRYSHKVHIKVPLQKNDREKLNFLIEQYLKNKSEKTSRLDLSHSYRYRFRAQNDFWYRLTYSLRYNLYDKDVLSLYTPFNPYKMIPFSITTSIFLLWACGNRVNWLYTSIYMSIANSKLSLANRSSILLSLITP